MTSTSARPTSDDVARVTARNSESSLLPPVSAATSPFHEILVHDVASTMPPELRERIHCARSIADLNDWIAVGAILRWLPERDEYTRRIFLREVGAVPRQAALSLVRAVATRMDPPPLTPERSSADRLGAVFQLISWACLLIVRSGWMAVLSAAARDGVVVDPWSVPNWIAGLVDLPLMAGRPPSAFAIGCALAAAALWHVVEIRYGPSIFEFARHAPAEHRRLPPLPSVRVDAFGLAWVGHSVVLAVLALVAGGYHVYRAAQDPDQEGVRVALVLLAAGLAWVAWQLVKVTRALVRSLIRSAESQ